MKRKTTNEMPAAYVLSVTDWSRVLRKAQTEEQRNSLEQDATLRGIGFRFCRLSKIEQEALAGEHPHSEIIQLSVGLRVVCDTLCWQAERNLVLSPVRATVLIPYITAARDQCRAIVPPLERASQGNAELAEINHRTKAAVHRLWSSWVAVQPLCDGDVQASLQKLIVHANENETIMGLAELEMKAIRHYSSACPANCESATAIEQWTVMLIAMTRAARSTRRRLSDFAFALRPVVTTLLRQHSPLVRDELRAAFCKNYEQWLAVVSGFRHARPAWIRARTEYISVRQETTNRGTARILPFQPRA